MFIYEKGIRLNGTALWLDASKRVESCVVSHGHMDHARKHQLILATEKTLHILKYRIGKTRSTPLVFGQPVEVQGATVTLFPAGHILGSAQVLIEMNGRRLLYSGDFNIDGSSTAESIEVPESDILIMECTFGRPHYRFPERELLQHRLLTFVEQTLNRGQTPVVVAYALGKSQEAMKIIGDAGYKMAVHHSIAQMASVYEKYDVQLGDWQKLQKNDIAAGQVLIVAHHVTRHRFMQQINNRRTLYLSGWAVDPGFRYRVRTDEALPFSDHADFDGLIEYVRRVKPQQVYTTHGFDEFAFHLRQQGYNAQPLKKRKQLELF